jgi:predicted RNA-binding protein YlqC (UPF0109 family)
MVASKNKRSEITDSIKKLMVALDQEILPTAESLKKHGWISADEYGKVVGRSGRHMKNLLDNSKAIIKKKARGKHGTITLYKAK